MRSTNEIVAAANTFVLKNRFRYKKAIVPTRGKGLPIRSAKVAFTFGSEDLIPSFKSISGYSVALSGLIIVHSSFSYIIPNHFGNGLCEKRGDSVTDLLHLRTFIANKYKIIRERLYSCSFPNSYRSIQVWMSKFARRRGSTSCHLYYRQCRIQSSVIRHLGLQ